MALFRKPLTSLVILRPRLGRVAPLLGRSPLLIQLNVQNLHLCKNLCDGITMLGDMASIFGNNTFCSIDMVEPCWLALVLLSMVLLTLNVLEEVSEKQ